MLFALGFIAGMVTAGVIFAVFAYFRAGVEKSVRVIETRLAEAGPKARGFIVEPPDEAEEARQRIIEKNDSEGKDTKIEELL